MSNIISVKRHSLEEAQRAIAKYKNCSFDDFHQLFREGKTPTFDEIEGYTLLSLLAWNPKGAWWSKASWAMIGDNLFARWQGKRFITPFADKKKGEGTNVFRNRLFPRRYPMDTSIEKSQFDQKPCLIITYPHFPSSLYGLRDELRKIDDGVFLGQGYSRPLLGKGYSLRSYFVLCALNKLE